MEKPSPAKRRNAPATKARIIAAAARAFSEHGYAQAGIREIARDAGVAGSLIVQHFGSKARLFEAAMSSAMTDQALFEGDRAEFGARMARLLVVDADVTLPTMLILSIGDADARAITARITRDHIIEQFALWLGPPNAHARAMNIIALCTGFVVYARSLPIGEVNRHSVDWLARTVQALVDEH